MQISRIVLHFFTSTSLQLIKRIRRSNPSVGTITLHLTILNTNDMMLFIYDIAYNKFNIIGQSVTMYFKSLFAQILLRKASLIREMIQ